MTHLQTITPERAAELVRQGAVLIDVREADEHARERIPGARHRALSALEAAAVGAGEEILVFHCRTGMRTLSNAGRLAAAAPCEAYILEGGLEAWKKAGLPVVLDRKQPIDLLRQMQITAGSLALAGVILGFAVHPGFFLLSAAVGLGLVSAGVTGYCPMIRTLARMPWNRRAPSGQAKPCA
jgi:rhodanese-related sulfurtransferase